MKPVGPIPAAYVADADGMLLIGGQRADALVQQAGDTPCFIYDMAHVAGRVARLRAAMPAMLDIHYAIKANPHPALLAKMAGMVDGFDIASAGEGRLALDAGMDATSISFAGPGKRDDELRFAIQAGITLNVESEGEAERALMISQQIGVTPKLAVRVNPDFDLKGSGMRMGGGAKPFGVDADRVPALIRHVIAQGAEWRGLHIFAGSQALSAESIAETQAATIALAARIADDVGTTPPLVNLGGGFGVAYFHGDVPLDIDSVGRDLERQLSARPASLQNSQFAIELGRWFVAEAGVYLTRIVDRKTSHDQLFLVCDGGLHHQLAASGNFGTVIRRNYPVAIADQFAVNVAGMADSDGEVATIVGCLCTPIDRLAEQVRLPCAKTGQLAAIFLAGAYGASASPAAFLGHPAARELIINAK